MHTLMYSAESTIAYKDPKMQSTTQKSLVSSTTQSGMTSTQPRGKRRTDTEPENFCSSITVLVTGNNDITSRGYNMALNRYELKQSLQKVFSLGGKIGIPK